MLNTDCLFSERKYIGKDTTAQHFNLKEIEELLDSEIENYKLFTIVRNPFDRMVSEYNHIQYNDWATEYKNLSFDDFVFKSLDTDIKERIRIFDAHLETQTSFIEGKNASKVKIFKYEQLDKVFNWLRKETGENLTFGHERKSSRKPYRLYFNKESTIQKIREFYYKDFISFDYEINLNISPI